MRKRWILLATVFALVAAGYASGAWQQLTDQQELRRLLLASGAWGGVLFVALFAVLVGLGSPALLLIVPASLVWPLGHAAGLVYVGSLGSAVVGFCVARYGARDWVEGWLPPQVRAWDERLEAEGFRAALVMRLLFFAAPWTHWVLGLSRVQFGPYMAASLLGFIPWSFFWVYAGQAGTAWLRAQGPGAPLGLVAVAVAFVVIRRLRRGRSAA